MNTWIIVLIALWIIVGIIILFATSYMSPSGRNNNTWWQNILVIIGWPFLILYELFFKY